MIYARFNSKLSILSLVGTVLFFTHIGVLKAEGLIFKTNNKKVLEQGKAIYADQCASCHGENLEGEPNWRERKADGKLPAPPHDMSGHTWHHPEQALFDVTKYGLAKLLNDDQFQTDMPVFEDSLTDEEIIAVLSYIKSTWPMEVQQRHDAMSAQQ